MDSCFLLLYWPSNDSLQKARQYKIVFSKEKERRLTCDFCNVETSKVSKIVVSQAEVFRIALFTFSIMKQGVQFAVL